MAIQKVADLTSSIVYQYITAYLVGVDPMRLYDQFSVPYTKFSDGKSMDELMSGSLVQVPFRSGLQPAITAISETVDVTPQILRDAYKQITPTSRGEAVQWAQNVDIQTMTPYAEGVYSAIGANAGQGVDLLAQEAGLQGSWVERSQVRASLDAGTSTDRLTESIFKQAATKMMRLRAPGFVNSDGVANTWGAIMPPEPYHDLLESVHVESIGNYQDEGIHLNWELAKLGHFRLLVSPWAKVFGAAGADNGTDCDDTLGAAANRLATTITTTNDVASAVVIGDWIWLGTEETAGTFYAANEPVKVLSASTTTVTILGGADNGGLLYDHDSGVSVRNADSVYPVMFGGPASLIKIFATDVGEYGKILPPDESGLLKQFRHVGWKYWGNYGLLSQHRALRWEVSVSAEA